MTDKITIDRAVVEKALVALTKSSPDASPLEDDYQEKGWAFHHKAITTLRAALDQPMKQPDGLPMVIAGALFDFAGFLTTREKLIVVGSTADAAPIADLVKEWAGLRELSLDDAAVRSWQEWVNPQQQPAVPPDWRELCRRLYVELFHVDQQLCSILDDEGEPICTQGSTVRNVLADAKAALNAAPEAPSQTEKKLSINDCYYCNFSGFSHCSRPDVAQAIQLAGGKPGSRCSNREVYGDRVHPIDDGDVTGFAGLLPETGWDEAPAAQKEQP